jgi:predicted MFS family arabinose efflux permease
VIAHDPLPSAAIDSKPAALARPSTFVATLAVAMGASVLLQVVFGALGPFLTEALDLTRTQLGTLTTALYVTGAFLSPVAGRLVDAFSGRRLLVALFALNALSVLVVAGAPSYVVLLGGALFGGLAVAIGNPATNLLIAAHAPRERQGVVTGVKQSGVQLAVFLGGAALPPLAQVVGWRGAALAGLALPALGLAGTAAAVPVAPRAEAAAAHAPRPRLPAGIGWLTTYALGMGIGVSALGAYLPLYGVQRLGLPAAAAGLLVALLGAVGVVARIAWGRAADRSTTPPARSLALLAAASIVSGVLILAAESWGTWLAWAGAALNGASAAAWNAVGMLAIVRGAPLAVAGRASGVVLLSFYGGFVVGPSAFGILVDATGSYTLGWAFVLAAFAVSTVVAVAWATRPARPSPG